MPGGQATRARNAPGRPGIEEDFPSFCQSRPLLALFLVSVLGLFLELLLIRWISTEVRIFAYLQNTVLVLCFLGLGLGCFTCQRPVVMRGLLVRLLILVVLLAIPNTREFLAGISDMLSVLGDLVVWEQEVTGQPWEAAKKLVPGLLLVYLLMLLIWDMFVPIGRLMGRLLENHPKTIRAYSVNVAGSLLGIWLFVALSVFYLSPFVWITVVALLILPFVGRPARRRVDLLLLGCIVVMSWFASQQLGALSVYWSPYQKLTLKERAPGDPLVGEYVLTVNNAAYQAMIDLGVRPDGTAPLKKPPGMRGFSQYDIPALLHPNPRSMLIVGAGAGNDAAGALRNGVERVVAVEIDPAIIDIGQTYHPERPYSSPRVTVVNDDARSYFAGCKEHFDVISFGLLDSHTTLAMTNARLDHYVYTRESIEQAKSLLADGGVIVLTFEARKEFIADRIARVLRDAFDEEPICFRIPFSDYGWGGVMFVSGNLGAVRDQIRRNVELSKRIALFKGQAPTLGYKTAVVTDDWPYIYLRTRSIPILYWLLAGLMAVLAFHSQRRLGVRVLRLRGAASRWHFFFLGAAFLLLEVQNISKASVALGSTWQVNAVIISAILAMVLLANAIAACWKSLPQTLVYLLLVATCVVLYFVDISRFASLPYATKALVVGGLTTLPMLFGGIIFIRSFASVQAKGEALGANLIGSLVGGILQSVTFLTGTKALLLIVTAFYVLAVVSRPRTKPAASESA